MLGRHLHPAHDARSLSWPAETAPVRTLVHRHEGPVLDQGDLGSCTGNACAQALNTQPLRPVGRRLLAEVDAVALYSLATCHDPFPGVWPTEDTGSDGLSVAKAARRFGLIRSYRHAFGLDHMLGALMRAPLIVGTKWTSGMFVPDADGFVRPTGDVVGGHEWMVYGVDVEGRFVHALNSWGPGWGIGGSFRVRWDDLQELLADRGDATQLVP